MKGWRRKKEEGSLQNGIETDFLCKKKETENVQEIAKVLQQKTQPNYLASPLQNMWYTPLARSPICCNLFLPPPPKNPPANLITP